MSAGRGERALDEILGHGVRRVRHDIAVGVAGEKQEVGDLITAAIIMDVARVNIVSGGGAVVFAANATLAPGEREAASLYGLMALAGGATREHVNRWRAAVTFHELV